MSYSTVLFCYGLISDGIVCMCVCVHVKTTAFLNNTLPRTYLILTTILWDTYYNDSQFTDLETKTQRG